MLLDKLQQLGLTEKEAKIYMATLELGHSSVQRLSNKTKIKRSSIYDVLDSLKEKGLVSSTIINKKRRYIASDPRELEFKIDEKKRVIQSIVPELLSIANIIGKKPKIRFYEGDEGLKEVFLDTLNYKNQPIWAWISDDVWKVLGWDFLYHYLDQRVKKGIWAYVIASDTPRNREYKSEDKKYLRKTKFDKKDTFLARVEIDLYGNDRIGITAFEEKIGLIIESKKIFDTLKSIFDSHWEYLED